MDIEISVLALLATFYQLYLQRKHNEKSLKPLGQIDFRDRNNQIYVCIANNGLGPMIIDRITLIKDGRSYNNIEDCLNIDPKSYKHIALNGSVKKVILPSSKLEVFETIFENHDHETEMDHVRNQLTPILLKVDCRDIYDNTFSFKRKLEWFSRHDSK